MSRLTRVVLALTVIVSIGLPDLASAQAKSRSGASARSGSDATTTVEAVVNHGAGDVLEIRPPSGGVTVLVPFSKAAVPVVDVAGRRIVVDPPAGLLDPVGAPEPGEDVG